MVHFLYALLNEHTSGDRLLQSVLFFAMVDKICSESGAVTVFCLSFAERLYIDAEYERKKMNFGEGGKGGVPFVVVGK